MDKKTTNYFKARAYTRRDARFTELEQNKRRLKLKNNKITKENTKIRLKTIFFTL